MVWIKKGEEVPGIFFQPPGWLAMFTVYQKN